MILKILGSGGAMPTPRAFCQCNVCKKSRTKGVPYKRNSSSLFIKGIDTLIDAPEDIVDSINRMNIKKIKNIFITHWHPDHSFGLRSLLESNYNFRKNKAESFINLYISKRVYTTLIKHYPVLKYLKDYEKVVKIKFIEDGKFIKIGKVKITPIAYNGKLDHYAFLIEENKKKVIYSPCDTIGLKKIPNNMDLWITECGLFSYNLTKTEISFPDMIDMIKKYKPKKTILTHIEEVELKMWGINYLKKMKKKYSNVNFDFAFDGQEIKL